MTPIPQLLEIAKTAALAAGEAIMDIYKSGNFGIDKKSDLSPLTLADQAAHAIIALHLEKTGLPMLSEEGRYIPYQHRKGWDYYWLVDPLDGTKEFINKNGEFTVNIALLHYQTPVAGVIYAPCLSVLYYGSQETGVYKIEKGQQTRLLPVNGRKTLGQLIQKEHVKVVASRSHMNVDTAAFISQFSTTELISMGSSLKLMLLTEGAADIYPRLGPTMEWDTAASHALLRVLDIGVYQTNLQTELVYNKEDLVNPSFIAM